MNFKQIKNACVNATNTLLSYFCIALLVVVQFFDLFSF